MRLGLLMADLKGLRRLRTLNGHFKTPEIFMLRCKSGDSVSIGNATIAVKDVAHLQNVPRLYLEKELPRSTLQHLKWMIQKDLLGQDIFLIGSPGPLRRRLALMYLEMSNKEFEYIALSRDTTESDLKQRREIRDGTAFYVDQCAVRAATNGRVLVLEGIEKAERNVLPVLNNLLENREMQLEDGRFLMRASTYDKLLQTRGQDELDEWKLVRVNDDFRVIALGVPVPKYQGNPLDPPLRSRFQARDVNHAPFKEHYDALCSAQPQLDRSIMSEVLSFSHTLLQEEAEKLGIADFPLTNMHLMTALMNESGANGRAALDRLYPYALFLNTEGKNAVESTLQKFSITDSKSAPTAIAAVNKPDESRVSVRLTNGRELTVKSGNKPAASEDSQYISTESHDALLVDLIESHKLHDICLIGPKGCGKSTLIRKLATTLGYHYDPILLYQDMTSRDLLQQRTTSSNGDTAWRFSPLLEAAIKGHIAILDGLHRINAGTFSVLASLILDREMHLADGSRLLREDRFDALAKELSATKEQLNEMGVLRIHPSFRMIALAEPPVLSTAQGQWLNSEMLSYFLFHEMKPLPIQDEIKVVDSLVHAEITDKLFELSEHVRRSRDPTVKALADSLSTRNLVRMAKRLSNYETESLHRLVHATCMSRFLPKLAKQTLEQTLETLNIQPSKENAVESDVASPLRCEVSNGKLTIGNTTVSLSSSADNQMKIPDTLFYDNELHISVMESMLKDWLIGEHLLLVGNQGVGKNKVVDRFLQLLGRSREYIQLHRDTTVQTLTLQPTVRDGRICYDDSPLVKAVREGHVLVIDEADKAPTNVTCVLKTLVESGQMHLADGRKIISDASDMEPEDMAKTISMHPDFKMIVLANRPGFPFLGNDFFSSVGDLFSCIALDNPDIDSEIAMLRKYGPDVPEATLRQLVIAFGELRQMADNGLISYPYSTREVVNIVKHLQVFPDDGLASVVANVFDFDQYNKEMKDTVVETMHKHGIPIGANPSNINLAKEYSLPALKHTSNLQILPNVNLQQVTLHSKPLKVKGPVQAMIVSHTLDHTSARSTHFSELATRWTVPLFSDSAVICDVATALGRHRPMGQKEDLIHIAGVNPVSLYSMSPGSRDVSCIDLYDAFPSSTMRYQPSIRIATLGASVYDTVLVHEQVSNTLLSVNTESGRVSRFEFDGLLEKAVKKIPTNKKPNYRMVTDHTHTADGLVLLYEKGGDSLTILDVFEGTCSQTTLPFTVTSLKMASPTQWVFYDNSKQCYLAERSENSLLIKPISTDQEFRIISSTQQPLNDASMKAITDRAVSCPNRMMASSDSHASLALGFPELQDVELYQSPRDTPIEDSERNHVVIQQDAVQIIRSLPGHQPPKILTEDGAMKIPNLSGYLEVADIMRGKLRYLPVSGSSPSPYMAWYKTASGPLIASLSNDALVSVDSTGNVQVWELSPALLGSSLANWQKLIGYSEADLQMTYDRDGAKDCDTPKHGKVDSTGAPHVGGNTWAGGTGGRDTAGLGGVGGPYRLDAGHDVHQVPQEVKDQVPEHIRQAAREMGQKAFKERLKQINMSEFDAEVYDRFLSAVKSQISSLRVVLDSLQAKGKERQWIKNQTYGDLDDGRIIEGLTGEKSIYRRRGEKEPEMGSPQEKPKRLRMVVDVSGSMYRFNGYDGRMEREMEAICMVMEAFSGYEEKLKYDVYGHSGEDHKVEMTSASKPPKDDKQRLQVLQTMHAHSQFCLSGDFTLAATRHAIEEISKEEADEHFVIVLSDANLERYGIPASSLADALTSKENVNSYVIFIGSLGDQAHRLIKQLPSGHAFVCMDTSKLPEILQQIFTSTFLK